MLPVDEAIRKWLAALVPLEAESVAAAEAAGRVAAEDIRFPHDLPPFSNSAMDGFAVRHEDLVDGAPVRVVGEVAAGSVREEPVGPGQAVRIMTGSPVPPGADTVVPVEDVEESGGDLRFLRAPAKGAHIRPAGDDVRAGDPMVRCGEVLGPGHLACLASGGILRLRVTRRPRVALLTTGDEVVPPETDPPPGKIRNGNAVLLKTLLGRRGVSMTAVHHVDDDLDAMTDWLASAVSGEDGADLVVTTGGVSVGRYDFVRPLLSRSGFEEVFWRVRMKPGKPILTARRSRGRPVYACGLPGNPVSAFVGALLYVVPAVDRLENRNEPSLTWHTARLKDGVKAGPRTFFMTGRVRSVEGRLVAEAVPRQGSHRISSLLGSNALIRIDENCEKPAGEEIPVLVWGDL